ncbi:hypothetical protein ACROYT_G016406 [Oculina patagonica]
MIVSRIKKIFFLCLFVSAAIVVREVYRFEFLLPLRLVEIARDHLPRDKQIRYQPARDQPPRDHDGFLDNWCRLQRSRVDWRGLLKNCHNKMAWKQRQVDSINRTDANKSFISRWEIKPQGDFSRFYIQSVSSNGHLKRTGGDSWRVHIRQGPASLAPMVTDHNDGTYEVMFLAVEPGNYSAQVFLDFTLCDGFRDPPEDWYIKGDIQGHRQQPGILGYIDDDFIKAPLQSGAPVKFYIKESSKNYGYFKYIQPLLNGSGQTGQAGLAQLSCNTECPLLWNGFGRWVNNIWKPYIPEEVYKVDQAQSKKKKLQTLMIYGDSIGVRYHTLASKRRLCKEMFRTCNKKYMWTYDASWKGNDNKDFNQSIVLEEIKNVFRNRNMRRDHSVFLFNVGIHYPISLNFTTYQLLIDNIIKILGEETGTEDKEKTLTGQALSIWRSTTALEAEHFSKFFPDLNYTEWRFHTNSRSQLFHTYATSAMCKAGIPVLDMYPLTASWPDGTRDSIHYADKPMEPAIEVLERFLAEHLQTS